MSIVQPYGAGRRRAWLRAPLRRPLRLRSAATALAGLADAAVIIATSVATGAAYHLFAHGHAGALAEFAAIGVLAAWLFTLPNAYRGGYAANNYLDFRPQPERILQLWTFVFVGLVMIAFLTKTSGDYSRGWAVSFYLAGGAGLVVLHAGLVALTRWGSRAGVLSTRRVVLVGTEPEVRDFVRRYRPWQLGLDIIGVHYLTAPIEGAQARSDWRPELGAALAAVRVSRPDSILLVIPWSRQDMIAAAIRAFMTVPASLHLGPEPILDQLKHLNLERLGPLASLHLLRPPLSGIEVAAKRALDIAVASLALVMLAPLFAVVAVLIKRDSAGPVFFRQRRYGFNQRPFGILKFRTMHTLDDGPVVAQAVRGDPRITRLGHFLRRSNIDELPQLLNVLRGDMSIVGPRPHALAHDDAWGRSIGLYARRHNVKPGITGWAQVNGLRGHIDSDEVLRARIACDLYYIDNWSLWLDLKIILLTVFSPRAYTNAG